MLTANPMARGNPNIPGESELLCETCGYRLTGLSPDARCPECGTPVADSLAIHRRGSPWELERGSAGMGGFFITTGQILLWPGYFFRHLSTRGSVGIQHLQRSATAFRNIHFLIVSVLLGWTLYMHELFTNGGMIDTGMIGVVVFAGILGTYVAMLLTAFIAARLTHWEASYRGLRLPLAVVRRALAYHAANYLPVALVAVITTTLFWTCRESAAERIGVYRLQVTYLYTLSGEVILAAGFLFWRYWIAMRNLMFANG
jgi:hypothetical protein